MLTGIVLADFCIFSELWSLNHITDISEYNYSENILLCGSCVLKIISISTSISIYISIHPSIYFSFFLCFFLSLTLPPTHCSVEGYCCTWSHWMTHTHTHSVGILWTRNRSIAETSTWQCNTHNWQISMPPGRIWTRYLSKRAAAV